MSRPARPTYSDVSVLCFVFVPTLLSCWFPVWFLTGHNQPNSSGGRHRRLFAWGSPHVGGLMLLTLLKTGRIKAVKHDRSFRPCRDREWLGVLPSSPSVPHDPPELHGRPISTISERSAAPQYPTVPQYPQPTT